MVREFEREMLLEKVRGSLTKLGGEVVERSEEIDRSQPPLKIKMNKLMLADKRRQLMCEKDKAKMRAIIKTHSRSDAEHGMKMGEYRQEQR